MTQKHATQTIKEGLADALDELEDTHRNGKKPTLNGQWLGALGEHLVAKAYRATHAGHRVEQYDLEFGAENIEVKSTQADRITNRSLAKKRCSHVAYVRFEAVGTDLWVREMYIRPRGKPGDRPNDPENPRVSEKDRRDLLPSPDGFMIDLRKLSEDPWG